MPIPPLTIEEIISTIRHSSLPTVITEGKDDYAIFRRIEGDLSNIHASVMPVGGRTVVLSLLDRRGELGDGKIAFIIDSDMWIATAIPQAYANRDDVVLSAGYSIENDLFEDGNLERFLTLGEAPKYRTDLAVICRWFSFCVEEARAERSAQVDFHPDRITDYNTGVLLPNLCADIGYREPLPATVSEINNNYIRMLRGKTLLATLVRHLSYAGRVAKHNARALMEMAVIANGPNYRAIVGKVSLALG